MNDIELAKKYKDKHKYLEQRREILVAYYEFKQTSLKIVEMK